MTPPAQPVATASRSEQLSNWEPSHCTAIEMQRAIGRLGRASSSILRIPSLPLAPGLRFASVHASAQDSSMGAGAASNRPRPEAVFLSNLDPTVCEAELRAFLSVAATVDRIAMVRQLGQSVGMA